MKMKYQDFSQNKVSGGETGNCFALSNVHSDLKFKPGFFSSDMGCLDATEFIPKGQVAKIGDENAVYSRWIYR